MGNLPVHMARWSARHPWRAIVGWFVFVVLCLGAGAALGGHAATADDFRVGEAGRAEAIAASGGLEQKGVEKVLITARSGELDGRAADAAARDVVTRMRGLAEVADVADPLYNAGRTAVRVDVTLKGAELDAKNHVDPVLAQTAQVAKAYPALRVEESGGGSISKDVQGQRGDDLSRTELIALPVTLLTLLLVFRSAAMATVPLLVALTSIAAAIGLSMIASHAFPDAGVGTNVILLIGLAVGVDYTLFYLKREREERARAGGRLGSQELVELAAATSGRAVVVSGLAVAASSATLYLADDVIFSSLATGAIVVALAAVVSSMTVLPAVLVKLGVRAERRAERRARKGKVRTPREQRQGGGRLVGAVLRGTARRPAATLAVGVLALLALAAPLGGLKLTDIGRETYSRGLPAMQAWDRTNQAFPEQTSMNQVLVKADPGQAGAVAAALRDVAARAKADPVFAGTSTLRTSADHRVTMLELGVPAYVSSDRAHTSLAHLRQDYLPSAFRELPDPEVAVTGDIARFADYPAHQKTKMPLIIGALLLVTFALTVWAFGSLVVGLLGVLLNLLSAGAALGVLTLVFQGSWAEGALGFTSTGSIGSRVPLFLFVILFGLSMDYQVFVVSRIREAVLRGESTRKAVLDGIGSSASVVTSAAFVMVTVFASFVGLHLIEMKQIGFSLAVAVLLDAFVIRVMVLPAALLLLGERAWYPSRAVRRARAAAAAAEDRQPAASTANVG
ncbi:MMPL family transporter [Streptomyces sp. NPDC021020]|uniref:MMPL family transporter n=1 Tax=Streptomyces sp. NPDC021020 TaxID=3365109 RepID=UPI0037ABE2C6